MKKLLYTCLFLSSFPLIGMKPSSIEPENKALVPVTLKSVQSSHDLPYHKVLFDGTDYFVKSGDITKIIHYYDIDPILRNKSVDQIQKYEKIGYLYLKKLSNGDYKLLAKTRLLGGGPVTGICAYWGTKVTAWSGVFAATFYDPELMLHYGEISLAIETAADAAAYLGTLAPTP